MAYQSIGIGSSANDGTGDTLRVGADKVNDNFVELYTKLGNGSALSNLTFPTGTDTIVGRATTDTLTNKTINGLTLSGTVASTATVTGTLDLTGTVLAGTNALVLKVLVQMQMKQLLQSLIQLLIEQLRFQMQLEQLH